MIKKFQVAGFKGFGKPLTLDLGNPNAFEFNKGAIKNGIVNNSIIYGPNGSGKSNLGLALFDIVGHLTDFNINYSFYNDYVNAP